MNEWHDKSVLNKFQNISWKESIQKLHDPKNINKKGPFFDRLAFDEILSSFLISSKVRKSIKKIKKIKKKFNVDTGNFITKKLNFNLTVDQINSINEINKDLKSNQKRHALS